MMIQAEPRLLYSNRSYWYPQSPVTDYATAPMRLSVPGDRRASPAARPEPAIPALVAEGSEPPRRLYVFTRRSRCAISRSSSPAYSERDGNGAPVAGTITLARDAMPVTVTSAVPRAAASKTRDRRPRAAPVDRPVAHTDGRSLTTTRSICR